MGTCNFRDYNSWLEGKVAILVYEPYQYSEEEDEEYLKEWCEDNDRPYEYLCPHCKEEILQNRDEGESVAVVEGVAWEAERLLKESFGHYYSKVVLKFAAEDGYYNGIQWFFNEYKVRSLVDDFLCSKLKELLYSVDVIAYEQFAGGFIYNVSNQKDYIRLRKWCLEEMKKRSAENSDEYKNLCNVLTDDFGEQVLTLRNEYENTLCKKLDNIVRQIAKNTGLKIAYNCAGWSGPSYVEP